MAQSEIPVPEGSWSAGETIYLGFLLEIPDSLPSTPLSLWAGVYDPASGRRLPFTYQGEVQEDGRVWLSDFEMK